MSASLSSLDCSRDDHHLAANIMKPKFVRTIRSVTAGIIICGVLGILSGPQIYARLALNLSSLALLSVAPCDTEWYVCQSAPRIYPPIAWTGSLASLEQIEATLTHALEIMPDDQRIKNRLAEVYFGLGERDAAASLSTEGVIQYPMFAPAVNGFRLLGPTDYRGYLIAARQYAQTRNWENAVLAYRLALSVGASYLLPVDKIGYAEALANLNAVRAKAGIDSARQWSLSGRYFIQSGSFTEAQDALWQAIKAEDWEQLSSEDQALNWTYLGQTSEVVGGDAQQYYAIATDLAPYLNEPYIRSLRLAKQTGIASFIDQASARLAQRGPRYRLGRSAEGYQADSPASPLPEGWKLIGYDLDQEMLESGGWLDLWLWWEAPEGTIPQGEDWLPVGDYWLQRQSVLNLAPNAGFEWGTWSLGMPFGYVGEMYGAPPGSVALVDAHIQRDPTQILRMTNTYSRNVGIQTVQMMVDPEGLYLMAGQKRDTGNGSIGRLCNWEQTGAPYYISYEETNQPSEVWVQFVQLDRAMPEQEARECAVILLNYDTRGWAEWDNILFARIEKPGPSIVH